MQLIVITGAEMRHKYATINGLVSGCNCGEWWLTEMDSNAKSGINLINDQIVVVTKLMLKTN